MVEQIDAGHIVKPSAEEFSAKNCPKGGLCRDLHLDGKTFFPCSKGHYFAPPPHGTIIIELNSLTGEILWGCFAVRVNLD